MDSQWWLNSIRQVQQQLDGCFIFFKAEDPSITLISVPFCRLVLLDEQYLFANDFNVPMNPRTDILFNDRQFYKTNILGTLDKETEWHSCISSVV